MKLPAIKKLIETYDLAALENAEFNMLEGLDAGIEVEGGDEGEKLTHILGAIEVLKNVEAGQKEPRVALREFFERVRNSIS